REAEMPAAEPDRRNLLAGAAERAVHRTVGRRMVGHCRMPRRKLGPAFRAIDVPGKKTGSSAASRPPDIRVPTMLDIRRGSHQPKMRKSSTPSLAALGMTESGNRAW